MQKLKVMTILGTRPEIIRLSRIIVALDVHLDHIFPMRPVRTILKGIEEPPDVLGKVIRVQNLVSQFLGQSRVRIELSRTPGSTFLQRGGNHEESSQCR